MEYYMKDEQSEYIAYPDPLTAFLSVEEGKLIFSTGNDYLEMDLSSLPPSPLRVYSAFGYWVPFLLSLGTIGYSPSSTFSWNDPSGLFSILIKTETLTDFNRELNHLPQRPELILDEFQYAGFIKYIQRKRFSLAFKELGSYIDPQVRTILIQYSPRYTWKILVTLSCGELAVDLAFKNPSLFISTCNRIVGIKSHIDYYSAPDYLALPEKSLARELGYSVSDNFLKVLRSVPSPLISNKLLRSLKTRSHLENHQVLFSLSELKHDGRIFWQLFSSSFPAEEMFKVVKHEGRQFERTVYTLCIFDTSYNFFDTAIAGIKNVDASMDIEKFFFSEDRALPFPVPSSGETEKFIFIKDMDELLQEEQVTGISLRDYLPVILLGICVVCKVLLETRCTLILKKKYSYWLIHSLFPPTRRIDSMTMTSIHHWLHTATFK